jgi:hypothetical protein
MVSSGLLRRVALVLVLTRATRRNNPEDTILHSHRRENLKSYTLGIFIQTIKFQSTTQRIHFNFPYAVKHNI